jgi:AP-4 complex subunit mu-1
MLARVTLVVGDYCGSITEEAIRKNFLMIYELIDEMMVYIAFF